MKRKDGWGTPINSRASLLTTGSLGRSGRIKSKLGSSPSPEDILMSCSNFSGWREAIVCKIKSISYRKKVTTNCEWNEKNEKMQVKKNQLSGNGTQLSSWFLYAEAANAWDTMTRKMPFFHRKPLISQELRMIAATGFHLYKLGGKWFHLRCLWTTPVPPPQPPAEGRGKKGQIAGFPKMPTRQNLFSPFLKMSPIWHDCSQNLYT